MAINQPKTQRTNRGNGVLLFSILIILLLAVTIQPYAYAFDGALKGVTITDSDGTNIPPVAIINYTKNGDAINFDATGSSDSDGSITEFRWDFGDGVTGVGATVSHTFSASGSFPVTLTAIDDNGGVALSQIEIITSSSGWINASGISTPWQLLFVDSEESSLAYDGRAINAFDRNQDTIWHTEWSVNTPLPPHEIQIDLGELYVVDGFRYLPRQDGEVNGTISQYEIFISRDSANWGEAVSVGVFSGDTNEKIIDFPATIGRYVRFRALSELKGQAWSAAAEIDVRGAIFDAPAVWVSATGGYAPWKLLFVDSEETTQSDGLAINAFDGNLSTIWHTEWSLSSPPPPHEIQIDLGELYAIDSFSYLPRQDGGINGTISQYEIYISRDSSSWGVAVASGTFTADTIKKTVTMPVTTGRYIKFIALSEVKGQVWTAVSEIDVHGKYSK